MAPRAPPAAAAAGSWLGAGPPDDERGRHRRGGAQRDKSREEREREEAHLRLQQAQRRRRVQLGLGGAAHGQHALVLAWHARGGGGGGCRAARARHRRRKRRLEQVGKLKELRIRHVVVSDGSRHGEAAAGMRKAAPGLSTVAPDHTPRAAAAAHWQRRLGALAAVGGPSLRRADSAALCWRAHGAHSTQRRHS